MTSRNARAPLFAVLLASLAQAGCLPPPSAPAEATVLAAPTEALELSDGARLQLTSERGKVFVLVFYAVWCPVSRKMLRALNEVATPSRRQRGLVVLAIDEEDGDAEAKQFAKAAGLTGPVGLDRSGDFTRAMKVDTVPALVAVGRDGVVRRSHAGYHGEADLAELGREVDALLAAPRTPSTASPAESLPDPAPETLSRDGGSPVKPPAEASPDAGPAPRPPG